MPSRRHYLAAVGTAAAGPLTGCVGSDEDAVTGLVARKVVDVAVVDDGGGTTRTTLGVLTYEPEQNLVTGEYASLLSLAVTDARLRVADDLHADLSDRFADVAYHVNVVPAEGWPAGGSTERSAFNRLELGGTATAVEYLDDRRNGRVRVLDAAPREREPDEVTLERYEFTERRRSARETSPTKPYSSANR
jgi:hypothetical protein